jgi:hypothetical protein
MELLVKIAQIIIQEKEMSGDESGRSLLPQVGELIAALGKLFGTMLGTTTPKTG